MKLKSWLEEDQDDRPFAEILPFPADKFKLSKKHIRRAIDHSNNSALGPDGIKFATWRKLGPLAVSTLFDAFQDMTAEGGPEMMAEQYQEYSLYYNMKYREYREYRENIYIYIYIERERVDSQEYRVWSREYTTLYSLLSALYSLLSSLYTLYIIL